VSILVKFADGSTGTIVYSSFGDAAVSKEYLEVFAAGRVAQINDFRRLTLSKEGRQKVTKSAQDKGHVALVAAFMKAVETGGAPPIPFAELAAVTETTFAIEEALRTGVVVEINSRSFGS
jgi:polar amino acid transport system substrate-binding protein